MGEQEIICIGCPLGCRVALRVSEGGEVRKVSGNKCKEGREYAIGEYRSPVRVLTATVLTEGGGVRVLLPVRTSRPIRKEMLRRCMGVLCSIRVKPPIRMGEVIVRNLGGTGADLISADNLLD
jgi:CxxC motif-containing protein